MFFKTNKQQLFNKIRIIPIFSFINYQFSVFCSGCSPWMGGSHCCISFWVMVVSLKKLQKLITFTKMVYF